MALSLLPLLLAAALVPSVAPASHALDNTNGEELLMLGRFHGWMAAYGRSYPTEEEKRRRFEIYRSNMEFIGTVNRDLRMSYRLGETPFTDLTHDEFMALYSSKVDLPEVEEVITTRAGSVHEGGVHGGDQPVTVDESPRRTDMADLPSSIDWRTKCKVTPVRDQGRCGSCWAFAATATMESAEAIKKGTAPRWLSPQQLVDCDSGNNGCRGGSPRKAFEWVKNNDGITSEEEYLYVARNGTCPSQEKKPVPKVRLSGYENLKSGDQAALKKAVAKQPVAVGFDVHDPCFRHYSNGIYDGKCFMPDGAYVACGTNPNHALVLVGYGTRRDGTEYWIARNSWGTGWGQDGYAYVLNEATQLGLCGLAKRPSYPIVSYP